MGARSEPVSALLVVVDLEVAGGLGVLLDGTTAPLFVSPWAEPAFSFTLVSSMLVVVGGAGFSVCSCACTAATVEEAAGGFESLCAEKAASGAGGRGRSAFESGLASLAAGSTE
jgi:hypothetical protein